MENSCIFHDGNIQALQDTVQALQDTVQALQDTVQALQDTVQALQDTVRALKGQETDLRQTIDSQNKNHIRIQKALGDKDLKIESQIIQINEILKYFRDNQAKKQAIIDSILLKQ